MTQLVETNGGTAVATTQAMTKGLLTPENDKALAELAPELTDAWNKRQVFRTEWEMRGSVLDEWKHPSKSAQYWQCVREQTVMLDNLAMAGFDYRRNEVKVAQLEQQIRTERDFTGRTLDEFEIQLLEIDRDECLFKKASLQQQANDRMREIKLWSALKSERDDGTFDVSDVNAGQLYDLVARLENRLEALKHSQSSQAEVANVLGPLNTCKRLLAEHEARKKG